MMNQKIKLIAEKYIGQTEVKNNMGFIDPNFEDRMEAVGWRPSFQWCALFSELVWHEAYQGNEDMLKVKLDLLDVCQLYVSKINKTTDEKVKKNLLSFVEKINRGLQLIDKMEQNIIASNINASEFRLISIKQSAEIENKNKTIIGLVSRLEKFDEI